MPKTKISEYSATANSNTDVASINIDEGCAPSGINNAIRAIMGHLKDFQSGTSNDPFTVGSSGSLTLSYGTANGVAYLNGSKVLTTGSALTFDGTNFATTGAGTFSGLLSRIHAQGTDAYITNTTTGKANTVMGFNDSGSTTAQGIPTGYAYYGTLQSYPVGFTSGGYLTNSISSTAHIWNTTGSEQMRLTSTGLGIGTSSPAVKLDVAGNATIQNGVLTIGKDTVYDAFINTPESMYFNVDSDGNSTGNRFVWGTDRAGTTGGTEWMRLDSSGNLLVGITSGATGLISAGPVTGKTGVFCSASTAGTAGIQGAHTTNSATGYVAYFANSGSGTGLYISNTAAWQSTSDERLKTDIQDLDSTQRLMQLRPRDYLWKSQETSDDPTKRNLGFIAQEVKDIFPELVGVSPDGMFSVEYTGLIAPLVKAIQEQQALITQLTARITALEGA